MDWQSFCSLDNIYRAWAEFAQDKQNKSDVLHFSASLEGELLSLYHDLLNGTYRHGSYCRFLIRDPKERIIHKASVRDRVAHRMIYNYLLPIFHPRWLDCSFSCRPNFGQHRAILAVRRGILECTKNYSTDATLLKCDIQKFFDHIDHDILYSLIAKRIHHPKFFRLIRIVLSSFHSGVAGAGLPIGNLTSQIFANIYMHEFDWFAKHELKRRWYYRYADDFLFCLRAGDRYAQEILEQTEKFLALKLRLTLHPHKIIIRSASHGIDWLGKMICPAFTVLRHSTRQRMMRKIETAVRNGDDPDALLPMISSYHGLLMGTARRGIDSRIRQAVALSR